MKSPATRPPPSTKSSKTTQPKAAATTSSSAASTKTASSTNNSKPLSTSSSSSSTSSSKTTSHAKPPTSVSSTSAKTTSHTKPPASVSSTSAKTASHTKPPTASASSISTTSSKTSHSKTTDPFPSLSPSSSPSTAPLDSDVQPPNGDASTLMSGGPLYLGLVVLRLLLVLFGFGYIHPDAYFQSSEILASDVFGFEVVRTWEFDPSLPCRTIFTPAIISGIPLLVLKGLSYVIPSIVNSYTLFYFPRIFLFLSSFVLDSVVWQLSGNDWDALYTLSSSWVLFAMINNSFSNTTETMILAISLWWTFRKNKTWSTYAIYGGLISIGVFNRFTFIFWVLPLVVFLFYEEIKKEKGKGDWTNLLTGLLSGFTTMSMLIVLVDSVYFGSVTILIGGKAFRWLDLLCPSFWINLIPNLSTVTITSFSWTITPVNSISYNSKLDNLSSHGNHLRITHLLWNLPLLFGPLAWVGLAPYYIWLDEQLGVLIGQVPGNKRRATVVPLTAKKLPKSRTTDTSPSTDKQTKTKLQDYKFSLQKFTIVASIVSGIVFLSIVPHQEMRFLYPILVPLILLGYKGIFGSEGNVWWKSGWFTFNVVLLLFMVILHQGGVVPSILKIASTPVEPGNTVHAIYYHTYMPPQYLFGITSQSGGKPKFAIHDLKGADIAELRRTILRITDGNTYKQSDTIFIVSPATVDLDNLSSLPIVRKQWLHYTSEDAPEWTEIAKFSLNIYKYTPDIPLTLTTKTTTETTTQTISKDKDSE